MREAIKQAVSDLSMPDGLSAKGKRAYKAIMQILIDNDALETGGCRPFTVLLNGKPEARNIVVMLN